MNAKKFFDMVASFDFYYPYSDDYRVWKMGNEKENYILSLTKDNEQFKRIYNSFVNYRFLDGYPAQNGNKPEFADFENAEA